MLTWFLIEQFCIFDESIMIKSTSSVVHHRGIKDVCGGASSSGDSRVLRVYCVGSSDWTARSDAQLQNFTVNHAEDTP